MRSKKLIGPGFRLPSDERILGSSEFVERTLKQAAEAYDRRIQLRSVGVDLSRVTAAVCRQVNIEEREVAGSTRCLKAADVRALISHIATRASVDTPK